MRNRKIIGIGAVLAALALVALVYLWPVNDPVYQGQALSQWVLSEGMKAGGLRFGGMEMPGIQHPPSDSQALEAISQVGTNALPMLVRMLGSKESSVERWSQTLADKYRLLRRFIFIPPRSNIKFARQLGAVVAFHRLGPRGERAVPDIVPLLTDPDLALSAMLALMYIRPEQQRYILSLTNVLRIQRPSITGATPSLLHSTAIIVLSAFGAKASAALPLLLHQMTSTNEIVRGAAAMALARIGAPPEKAVPLILQCLPNTNPPSLSSPPAGPMTRAQFQQMRQQFDSDRSIMMIMWALGEYGLHARAALPILSNLLSYPLGNVRDEAKLAIARITGDAFIITPFAEDPDFLSDVETIRANMTELHVLWLGQGVVLLRGIR